MNENPHPQQYKSVGASQESLQSLQDKINLKKVSVLQEDKKEHSIKENEKFGHYVFQQKVINENKKNTEQQDASQAIQLKSLDLGTNNAISSIANQQSPIEKSIQSNNKRPPLSTQKSTNSFKPPKSSLSSYCTTTNQGSSQNQNGEIIDSLKSLSNDQMKNQINFQIQQTKNQQQNILSSQSVSGIKNQNIISQQKNLQNRSDNITSNSESRSKLTSQDCEDLKFKLFTEETENQNQIYQEFLQEENLQQSINFSLEQAKKVEYTQKKCRLCFTTINSNNCIRDMCKICNQEINNKIKENKLKSQTPNLILTKVDTLFPQNLDSRRTSLNSLLEQQLGYQIQTVNSNQLQIQQKQNSNNLQSQLTFEQKEIKSRKSDANMITNQLTFKDDIRLPIRTQLTESSNKFGIESLDPNNNYQKGEIFRLQSLTQISQSEQTPGFVNKLLTFSNQESQRVLTNSSTQELIPFQPSPSLFQKQDLPTTNVNNSHNYLSFLPNYQQQKLSKNQMPQLAENNLSIQKPEIIKDIKFQIKKPTKKRALLLILSSSQKIDSQVLQNQLKKSGQFSDLQGYEDLKIMSQSVCELDTNKSRNNLDFTNNRESQNQSAFNHKRVLLPKVSQRKPIKTDNFISHSTHQISKVQLSQINTRYDEENKTIQQYSDNLRQQSIQYPNIQNSLSPQSMNQQKNHLQLHRMSDIQEEDSNYDQTTKNQENQSKRKFQINSFKDYKEQHLSNDTCKEKITIKESSSNVTNEDSNNFQSHLNLEQQISSQRKSQRTKLLEDDKSISENDQNQNIKGLELKQQSSQDIEDKMKQSQRLQIIRENKEDIRYLKVEKNKSSMFVDNQNNDNGKLDDQTSRIFSKQLTGLSDFSTVKSMQRKSIQSTGIFEHSLSKISSIQKNFDNQSDQSQISFFALPELRGSQSKLSMKHHDRGGEQFEQRSMEKISFLSFSPEKRLLLSDQQKQIGLSQNKLSISSQYSSIINQTGNTTSSQFLTANQYGKIFNLDPNFNAIPEEDEDFTNRRKSSMSKYSSTHNLPGKQQFLMKSNDQIGKSSVMSKNQNVNPLETEVKSVFMKSQIAAKLISNVKEKGMDLKRIDPYERLDKNSESYKQLQKQPISYKVIQARLDKWRSSKDGNGKMTDVSKLSLDISKSHDLTLDRSRSNTNKTPIKDNSQQLQQDLSQQFKTMNPVQSNFIKAQFTKGLIRRLQEQKQTNQETGQSIKQEDLSRSRNDHKSSSLKQNPIFQTLNKNLPTLIQNKSLPQSNSRNTLSYETFQKLSLKHESSHSNNISNSNILQKQSSFGKIMSSNNSRSHSQQKAQQSQFKNVITSAMQKSNISGIMRQNSRDSQNISLFKRSDTPQSNNSFLQKKNIADKISGS